MKNNDHIRVSSVNFGGEGVGFSGLQKGEAEVMEAFVLGTCWIRTTKEGRLESKPRFEELPAPGKDPKLPPSWLPPEDLPPFLIAPVAPLPEEPDPKGHVPSLIVQHLLGYNAGKYEVEALKLQAYGFECLRSRRGRNGKMWELWFLPSLSLAQGPLEDALHGAVETTEQIRVAVNFLCDNVSFGTLDVAYQRAAMVME